MVFRKNYKIIYFFKKKCIKHYSIKIQICIYIMYKKSYGLHLRGTNVEFNDLSKIKFF